MHSNALLQPCGTDEIGPSLARPTYPDVCAALPCDVAQHRLQESVQGTERESKSGLLQRDFGEYLSVTTRVGDEAGAQAYRPYSISRTFLSPENHDFFVRSRPTREGKDS
jgi:hypothetical protein